jgi:hypothetical protein
MTKMSTQQAHKSEAVVKDRRVVDFVKGLDEKLFAFLGARLLAKTDEGALERAKRKDITMEDVAGWRASLPLDDIIVQFKADLLSTGVEYARHFIPQSIAVLGEALVSPVESTRVKAALKFMELNDLIGDKKISTTNSQVVLDNMEKALEMVKDHHDWDDIEITDVEDEEDSGGD